MIARIKRWIFQGARAGLFIAWTMVMTSAAWTQPVVGKISIVFPHDGQGHGTGIAQGRMLNISIWPTTQVACTSSSSISLLIAKNNEPTSVWGKLGQRMLHVGALGNFPTVEFNDIPADMLSNLTAQYRFLTYMPVSSSSSSFTGNVWVHALDARTISPSPVVPTGFSASSLPVGGVDTRIQVVWAHDAYGNGATVASATLLNIAVEVFEHGTLKAVPTNAAGKFDYALTLYMAEGNNLIQVARYSTLISQKYTANGQVYTRWTFNDVPVTPGRQYNFLVGATQTGKQDVLPYASIWTHASDARTMMPAPEEPPACIP